MLKKTLVLVALVSSPLCIALATVELPKIDLIIIGLLNLGFFFAGAITVIGILSILVGVFKLLNFNTALADLLLA